MDTLRVSGSTYPQPFVDTLPVELVAAGQNSQQLAGLKITHAHHTPANTTDMIMQATVTEETCCLTPSECLLFIGS